MIDAMAQASEQIRVTAAVALAACGAEVPAGSEGVARSPIDGGEVMRFGLGDAADVSAAIDEAQRSFLRWRVMPAPVRGALVKDFGARLAAHKGELADLITVEVGKIRSEALGEVQEMIDVCDYAVGLSRQLDGRTMPSERPGHRLMETWHPRGIVAVISAFNFPAAVWAWNTAIALVCGDPVIWKPSELTPLTSMACAALLDASIASEGAPAALHQLVLVDRADTGALIDDARVALVSATGSERMGKQIAPRVAARFGAVLLELGGNNAAIVAPSADLDLAVRAVVFSAAGTAGQRCTTLRRVIAHVDVIEELLERVVAAYTQLPIGDPFARDTLVGPLINGRAFEGMSSAIDEARAQGGQLLIGGQRVSGEQEAFYVSPAVVRMPAQSPIVGEETFAPLLYVMPYRDQRQRNQHGGRAMFARLT